MVRASRRTMLRTIKSQPSRFLSMIAIVVLGIGFITGLSATAPTMKSSVDAYYRDHNAPDITVIAPNGLSDSQIEQFQTDSAVASSQVFFSQDAELNGLVTRLYYLPLGDQSVNKLDLVSGSMPDAANQVLVEQSSQHIQQAAIGSTIDDNGQSLTVVGVVANPLFFSKEAQPSMLPNENLRQIIYFDSQYNPLPAPTGMYVTLRGAAGLSIFSAAYSTAVSKAVDALQSVGSATNPVVFLTNQQNASVQLFQSNADKIATISYVFPIFFVAVAALVVLTTMTRLVEEERPEIGCFRTLGYGRGRIMSKYLFYALLCSILGSIIGIAVGFRLLPSLIYNVYGIMFHLPVLTLGFNATFGLIAAVVITLAVTGVTYIVLRSSLNESPATLLKPTAPPKGKTIMLEHIPFVWRRLKFKYKSMFRNIFRYKKHFIMTIVSVAGCAALVFTGLALHDTIANMSPGRTSDAGLFKNMQTSISFISMVLVVSAAALSIIVIYSLTNVNIEERKREIATLMVLGYKDGEVTGYIYREVMVLSLIGSVIGLPVGYVLLRFVLSFMQSGAYPLTVYVNWYTWILTLVVSLAFTGIVDVILYRKIIGVDMNASLKAIE